MYYVYNRAEDKIIKYYIHPQHFTNKSSLNGFATVYHLVYLD